MSHISELFASYQSAAAVCGSGYNDHDLADAIVAKVKVLASNPTRMPMTSDPTAILTTAIAAIAASKPSSVRVLDFGGGAGHHYFHTKAILPHIDLQWAVVETEAMSESASSALADDTLKFFTSIMEALKNLGGCDLVFSSGAIQYHPSPENALDELIAIGAKDFVLARFPLFDGTRTVGVQTSRLSDNGPGPLPQNISDRIIRYPVTFCPKTLISEKLLGPYTLRAQFASPSGDYSVGGRPAAGAALLLHHRAPQ